MAQKEKNQLLILQMKETQLLILHAPLKRLGASLSLFTETTITDFPYFLTVRTCSPICLDSKEKECFL